MRGDDCFAVHGTDDGGVGVVDLPRTVALEQRAEIDISSCVRRVVLLEWDRQRIGVGLVIGGMEIITVKEQPVLDDGPLMLPPK